MVSFAVSDDELVDSIPHQASFPGGLDSLHSYLERHTKYPEKARKKSKEGLTICRFSVYEDGSIKDVLLMKSSGYRKIDKEVIRVVKSMPKWIPGTLDGKPVRMYFTLPMKFQLK